MHLTDGTSPQPDPTGLTQFVACLLAAVRVGELVQAAALTPDARRDFECVQHMLKIFHALLDNSQH